MVHATWGDWFVREEIEATDPDGLAVWYLGCNGAVLRSAEATVYIDPYFGDGNAPRIVRMIPVPIDPSDATECDAVLCTHEHIDHVHPPSYGPLVDELGAAFYGSSACYASPDYDGDLRVPEPQKHVIEPGDRFEIGDLTVHARAANDPDASGEVAYVIEHDAGTFFHGGDTRPADQSFPRIAADFDLDLGMLAMGSVGNIYYPDEDAVEPTRWYMDENQIIEAARQLELDRLMPTHWDMWRGVGAEPKALSEHAASFEYPGVIEPVTIGDRVDVGRAGIVQAASLRD
ncbi:MAG: MBL fold metallo-hydrolase [Halobacteriaceae archaeon]